MKRWILMGMLVGSQCLHGVAGAPKAPHWAFQPVSPVEPPAVTHAAWCGTPLDRFILARLEAHGLQPAPRTDRRALIRRASFDLTGLPPSAEEVDAFVADDSPGAFTRLVDRLLDSPHYGEHWGRHWLDVVRYADTAGETADYPVPVAWRYRNYVIDAFNADKPYDQFLREQIAGDILARSGPRERYAEQVTATGYLALSRRFGFDSENYHHLTLQDTIDNVGQSVLGLTLGCARCHAHKFDPVSMPDYYALYGIFDSTRYAFPGSEQKQRTRALSPLVPPEESAPRWREFEAKVASLARTLEQQKVPVPTANLRSLDELDGDFEIQAPAAGGSNGVLVPPWIYEGSIAVTTDAQSPYQNLHPAGRVGASIHGSTRNYRIAQALHPARTRGPGGRIFVNLDFRVLTNEPPALGHHRFWLGTQSGAAAVEVLIGQDSLSVRTGDQTEQIRTLKPGAWHNLQLDLDLASRTVAGRIGLPDDVVEFSSRPLSVAWTGPLNFFAFDGSATGDAPLPSLTLDNVGVQEAPIPSVTSVASSLAARKASDASDPAVQLRELVGLDGDFELQADDASPDLPWHPGPKSEVRLRATAQSPFRNLYSPGQRGIHLPAGSAYNGFGQALTSRWTAGTTGRLYAAFDFRCIATAGDGDGSWRYYLGHGAGSSAAVVLHFNRHQLFRLSGETIERVHSLQPGTWYQVQITLDLAEKRYTGLIASAVDRAEFTGSFAKGWDGTLDNTFIDSYGHLSGTRCAVEADNFVLREQPLPAPDGPSLVATDEAGRMSRSDQIAALRSQMARRAADAELARRELETLLVNGPFDLTYAVTEGTPHNARIQLRGEPDKPGAEVPRGFLSVLGGGSLPPQTEGSGRLELANWLASPSNPLTARVMVNRIWQYHFGQGLVKTPNDFGTRGQPPSHPELLDYLAAEFVRSGWSLKAMHRMIMSSAVYQQRSQWSAARGAETVGDPDADCPVLPSGNSRSASQVKGSPASDYFTPFTRRRLGAEETRDEILLVSGELDPRPGGAHPFPSPTGWGFTQHGPFSAVYDSQHRSVYLMTQRIKRHPFLALFDGADPNSSTPERRVTTVPTQALYFLNDPFVHSSAEKCAAWVAGTGAGEPDRIQAAYRRTLGRSATAAEQAEAAEFLSAYRAELRAAGRESPDIPALAALVRVLFGSNEFLTVD
ncbi:MAG: hypothetical protein RIS76_3366 [Verrucomicrobiota bacterium]|jgi:hypothetical protein